MLEGEVPNKHSSSVCKHHCLCCLPKISENGNQWCCLVRKHITGTLWNPFCPFDLLMPGISRDSMPFIVLSTQEACSTMLLKSNTRSWDPNTHKEAEDARNNNPMNGCWLCLEECIPSSNKQDHFCCCPAANQGLPHLTISPYCFLQRLWFSSCPGTPVGSCCCCHGPSLRKAAAHLFFSLLQEAGGMVLTNLSIQTCVGTTGLNVQKKQTKSHYSGIEEKKAFWGITGLKWRCQEHAWTRMTEVSFIEVLRFQTSDHHTGISGSLQYFGERGSCTNWHRSELVSYRTTQSHTQALAALI